MISVPTLACGIVFFVNFPSPLSPSLCSQSLTAQHSSSSSAPLMMSMRVFRLIAVFGQKSFARLYIRNQQTKETNIFITYMRSDILYQRLKYLLLVYVLYHEHSYAISFPAFSCSLHQFTNSSSCVL